MTTNERLRASTACIADTCGIAQTESGEFDALLRGRRLKTGDDIEEMTEMNLLTFERRRNMDRIRQTGGIFEQHPNGIRTSGCCEDLGCGCWRIKNPMGLFKPRNIFEMVDSGNND